MELLHFYASDWNQIIRDMERLTDILALEPFQALMEGRRHEVTEPLQRIGMLCEKLELTFSASYAAGIIATINGSPSMTDHLADLLGRVHDFNERSKTSREELAPALNPNDIRNEVAILRRRIDDELGLREFFAIPAGRREYFATPYLFGVEVSESFPAAAIDIEEAGKCFALGRWTACVMHLMRAMEFPVQALAHRLGVRYEFRGWDAVIKKMRSELEKSYDDMDDALKGKKEFFGHALDRLTGVKDALRNPTMHARVHYDPDRAEESYRAVRSFMQLMAEELTEVES